MVFGTVQNFNSFSVIFSIFIYFKFFSETLKGLDFFVILKVSLSKSFLQLAGVS